MQMPQRIESMYRVHRTVYGISHQRNQALDTVSPPPALASAVVDGLQKLGQPLAELGEQVRRHLLQLDVSVLGGVHRGLVVVVVEEVVEEEVVMLAAAVGGRVAGQG